MEFLGFSDAPLWRLAAPSQFSEPALIAHHSNWLCLLAVLMAIFAASVFLPVKDRFHRSSGRMRLFWWLGGGIAMGSGIWAMHFTAMLAFSLPIPIRYTVGMTLLSIIPAIIASGLLIRFSLPKIHHWRRLNSMALIMAVGIGSMHYIGMEAIVVSATMYYVPTYFVLSILAAYVFALVGISLYTWLIESRKIPKIVGRSFGSIMLGLSVSAMHFTAMHATYFQPQAGSALSDFSIPPVNLIIGIASIIILLLGMMIIGSIVDRRLDSMAMSLANSEMRFQRLAETTNAAIFTFKDDLIVYANPALCKITGYDSDYLGKASLNEIFSEEFSGFADVLQESGKSYREALYKHFEIKSANGGTIWLYFSLTLMEVDGETIGLGSAFDITEQKNAELNMRHLAFNDQLTQIGNRMMFMDRLEHHMAFIKRRESSLTSCIMLLDLDKFKAINDTYGHGTGDQLLVSVAERMSTVARKIDTVARLGGDEFVFLLEEMTNSYSSAIVADRISALLSEPHHIMDRELVVHCSIGVVELSSNYISPDQVLRDADIALYRAKGERNLRWVLFDKELDSKIKRTRLLRNELKIAVADRSLQLYYQPIVASDGFQLVGFEALARWQRKSGEWVSPIEFIPMAEESGLVGDIGLWALETACEQLASWNLDCPNTKLYVSINVAPVSFDDDCFSDAAAQMFETHGLAKGQIKLELTERMLVDDSVNLLETLNGLIDLGCELMIDDFGTGYSSLSYLHRLPIQTVKIDRSFVSSLEDEESTIPVVKTIIALAESLKMNVVSEGIENESQARQLAEFGSDQLQGYWFSRPMPPEEASEFLLESMGQAKSIAASGG